MMNRRSFRRLALSCCLVMANQAILAQDEIFVTNSNSNSVTVYALTASGNVAPLRILVGNATGLGNPSGIAVDTVNDELLVVNKALPHSVTVYPRTASGNVAPLRTLTGALTNLNDPRGVAVDTVNNEFAVANRAGNSVTVYARTASGDVAPLRTLQTTGFSNPWGLLIDTVNNEIAVANNGNLLSVYPRTGNGNIAPLRTISGSNTGFNNGPIGIALDAVNDEYLVSNPFYGPNFEPVLLFFARTASGNVNPLRVIGGPNSGLLSPNGLAVDPAQNEVFVPNSGANSVTVYNRLLAGAVTPLRSIIGANTQLNNPQFLVVTTTVTDTLFADGFE
jgi:DNA-binding beta-propeller fold protein YncE